MRKIFLLFCLVGNFVCASGSGGSEVCTLREVCKKVEKSFLNGVYNILDFQENNDTFSGDECRAVFKAQVDSVREVVNRFVYPQRSIGLLVSHFENKGRCCWEKRREIREKHGTRNYLAMMQMSRMVNHVFNDEKWLKTLSKDE